ncbi:MAG: glycosyltransferase, partial [Desulfobulbus sp.]|nr:glycosyltransferase [Desulfobulbus sp.]
MRIYLICKRYYTNKDLIKDRFGRLYHLPEQLVKNGAEVWVDAIDYRNKGCDALTAEGVHFRTTPASLPNILALPYTLYRHCLAAKPDIILASGDSHIGFMALLVAKKLRVPFAFDVYDYYPAFKGNRIPGMKTMFRYAVQKADLVLCASESLLDKLAPLNVSRLLVENGVDSSLFTPADMVQSRKALGLQQDAIFVGYFGSINSARGPLLIEACRIVRKDFPALHLLLAGKVDGVDVNESWIRYLGDLPQRDIPTLINACNVVTIPYADTPFNRMCGARKIAEYLACGKPVVATRVSSQGSVFYGTAASVCDATSHGVAD